MVASNREDPDRKPGLIRPVPLSGAWYWFPRPFEDRVQWTVMTCHDLGRSPETGHVRLWPCVLERLAAAWSRDGKALVLRLGLYYTGLPRGRVSRPGKTSLILHGKDAPIAGWEELVIDRFQLSGRRVKILFDEHETQIPGHSEAFAATMELPLLPTKHRPSVHEI